MNKRYKLIVGLIIFTIIFIIMIILLLLFKINRGSELNDMNNVNETNKYYDIFSDDNNTSILYDYDIEDLAQKKLHYVVDRNKYFGIDLIVSNYINYSGMGNVDHFMNIFSSKYISENNITKDNIMSKTEIPILERSNIYYVYDIISVLESRQSINFYTYIVEFKYRINADINLKTNKVLIVVDSQNATYEVYPENYLKKNNYYNLKEGDILEASYEKIEKNQDNSYIAVSKSDREMANKYFNSFKQRLIYDSDLAYAVLNDEYRISKFGTKEKFKKYLEENKYLIAIMQLDLYIVKRYDNYTDYICKDKYDNYYIFRQKDGIMRYTVFLDSYTVELDYFKEIYDNSNVNGKVGLQINKFKQMINSKDYNSIYNKLNTVFKNNNFASVSELETYLRSNIHDINDIEIPNIKVNEDYYICTCKLVNFKNKDESKNMNIIIKLIDNNNFEMSFSFE